MDCFLCWILKWVICSSWILTCLSEYHGSYGKRMPNEYCDDEDFQAECRFGEMVLMEKATFGRMKMGRCVNRDMGFLGCQMDVLKQMDKACTGKQKCEIVKLGKADFDDVDTLDCAELELYLEAQYSCVQALDTKKLCRSSERDLLVGDTPAFIYSETIRTVPCLADRHKDRVFRVTTLQGQQINVSLVDLEVDSSPSWQSCVSYGRIFELKTMQQTDICGGQGRKKSLMLSNSNSIEIRLDSQAKEKFMLEFTALGCPDLPSPIKGWKERKGNKLTLGCYNSQQTWQLSCEGNRWNGVIGNCSSETPKIASSKQESSPTSGISSDVWLALIIACGVIVIVSSVTFGVVCWRRKSLQDEITRMKTAGKVSSGKKADGKHRPESEYMFPNFRPRSTMSETEDAVYDFCFSPGSTQGTLPNNMTSSVTLPCRGGANIQYNNTMGYPVPPESPKYKTLVVVKG